MSKIDVVLSCYPEGTPDSPVDLGKKWQTFNQDSPPGFEVPESTLVILHPGDGQVFSAWTDWARGRKDVAVMAVSRDPAAFDRVLTDKKKAGAPLENCIAYHKPLVWHNEPLPRRQEWFSNLRAYMGWVDQQSFPVNDQSVTSLWEPLNKRHDIELGLTAELANYAGALAIAAIHGRGEALDWCEAKRLDVRTMDSCLAMFLDHDLKRGPDVLSYSVRRQRLSHTELLNRVMANLSSNEANLPLLRQEWAGLKADFYELGEWARLALTPDPVLRAALYFADPRKDASLSGGDVWSAPMTNLAEWKDTEAVSAATSVIEKALANLGDNPRVDTYLAALNAFTASVETSADAKELRTKGDVLKLALQDIKVPHGSRA